MAKKTKVTEQEKEKMWRLYQETPCYSKVAKKINRGADTVSKYVKEYEAAVRAAGVVLHAQLEKQEEQKETEKKL